MRKLTEQEMDYCMGYIQQKVNDWDYAIRNNLYMGKDGAAIVLVAFLDACEQDEKNTRVKTLAGVCDRAIQNYWDKYRGQMYELFTLSEKPSIDTKSEPEKQPEPTSETVPEQPKSAITSGTDSNNAIDPFIAYVEGRIGQNIEKSVMERIEPVIEKAVKNAEPKEIIVKTATQTTKIEGVTHEIFGKVLEYANAREPIYIYGHQGTGKNVLGQQVAKALGLSYYYVGRVDLAYKFSGFTDATGKYHETAFYKACINSTNSSFPFATARSILGSYSISILPNLFSVA